MMNDESFLRSCSIAGSLPKSINISIAIIIRLNRISRSIHRPRLHFPVLRLRLPGDTLTHISSLSLGLLRFGTIACLVAFAYLCRGMLD